MKNQDEVRSVNNFDIWTLFFLFSDLLVYVIIHQGLKLNKENEEKLCLLLTKNVINKL